MRYLHTMVRVSDLDASLDFYCAKLGLREVRRIENEKGRFTLVFLATPEDAKAHRGEGGSESPVVELTHNWDEKGYAGGRNFGHLAYRVSDIYAVCEKLMAAGVTINRPPRDGHMAFIRSPDGISIELLQDGQPGRRKSPGRRCRTPAAGSTEAGRRPHKEKPRRHRQGFFISDQAGSDSAQNRQNAYLRG